MRVEWDAAKDKANIAKHGLSLGDAVELLAGKPVITVDERHDYGEARYIAVGPINGRLCVCVFTLRGKTYRIISLRKANERERHDHQNP
ncbi:MAG: BrnT family toxin [Sphingomonadales bacterium]|nr:BrnT family toxin [Sphingomonadales bacterium]RIK94273.1 MAG: BrnT family toxin [Pseudomonadota bacterium]